MPRYYPLMGGRVLILEKDTKFPALNTALLEPDGLIAIGGDLSVERIICAYRQGIFPWFNEGEPILWWSPDPRMAMQPDAIKISRSLKKRIKKNDYEIRLDSQFRQVMQSCAHTPREGQPGTWISAEMVEAYCELHLQGYAHSVETWINDELVGGLYGVAIGSMFYGESMFHSVTDASKIAFVHLVENLKHWGYGMIDCQMHTEHLASLGAAAIDRHDFAQTLIQLIDKQPQEHAWTDLKKVYV